jgi:hypothetical protein
LARLSPGLFLFANAAGYPEQEHIMQNDKGAVITACECRHLASNKDESGQYKIHQMAMVDGVYRCLNCMRRPFHEYRLKRGLLTKRDLQLDAEFGAA